MDAFGRQKSGGLDRWDGHYERNTFFRDRTSETGPPEMNEKNQREYERDPDLMHIKIEFTQNKWNWNL